MKHMTYKINGVKTSVLMADSFPLRLRGLIGRRLSSGEGFLLRPCNSIHTWFMSYPIDVVYLDDNFNVLHCQRQVKPWRMGNVVRGAKQVLELPGGSLSDEPVIMMEVSHDADA